MPAFCYMYNYMGTRKPESSPRRGQKRLEGGRWGESTTHLICDTKVGEAGVRGVEAGQSGRWTGMGGEVVTQNQACMISYVNNNHIFI